MPEHHARVGRLALQRPASRSSSRPAAERLRHRRRRADRAAAGRRRAVTVDGEAFALEGRESVFAGVTDFLYAPRDARVEIASARRALRAALRAAPTRRLEPRYGRRGRRRSSCAAPASEPPGQQLLLARGVRGRRLIAVEVLTPGGNWSSYPPHKHDEDIPGVETALEEIYYYEVARGGFGYQRVYGSGTGREIDIAPRSARGDAIVMPHGYHGPSMAAPGYDLYYLNVMAGPGERAWRFTDDPAHAWIRDSWAGPGARPAAADDVGEEARMRLTVAQALVRFLAAQYTERDGVEQRLIAGCFGIFGHGNVAGVGQALLEQPERDALLPRAQRAGRWSTPRSATRA